MDGFSASTCFFASRIAPVHPPTGFRRTLVFLIDICLDICLNTAMAHEYRQALDAARVELERLEEQREEMDNRITQLKQTIVSLATLCNDKAILAKLAKLVEAAGITDNCREVLRTSDFALSALEVKDRLLKLGLDASKYTNLLASIHAVLKRLAESGEVRTVQLEDGSTAYKWRRWRFDSQKRPVFIGGSGGRAHFPRPRKADAKSSASDPPPNLTEKS